MGEPLSLSLFPAMLDYPKVLPFLVTLPVTFRLDERPIERRWSTPLFDSTLPLLAVEPVRVNLETESPTKSQPGFEESLFRL
jgi:hypothetical protein